MKEAGIGQGKRPGWSIRLRRPSGSSSNLKTERQASDERSAPARMAYMQALRLGFVVFVLWSGLFAETLGQDVSRVFLPTIGYGLLIVMAEEVRRRSRAISPVLTVLMLLADAFFLAWTILGSGGLLSPVRFLVYIHLISATLIYSYRLGILLAFVHSLLLYGIHQAELADVFDLGTFERASFGEGEMALHQSLWFNMIVYWLITLSTAPFSSLNERELRRRKADLGVLAEMANELENLQEPSEIASAVLDRICDTFDFGRGVILAVHGDQLVLMAQRGTDDRMSPSTRIDRLIDKAWDKHDAVLVARLHEETDPMLAELMPFGHNLLVAPMFADGQPFGVLVVERTNQHEGAIQRRVISMVLQFASHGALAMRKAWLVQEVQRLAETDALTEISNRRAFEKAISSDVSRSIRSREELTLVLVDLDHFKYLNDTFGHQVGDDILRRVGEVLRTACRESDTPARYGGEEFAVLLPACGREEAIDAAERIRSLIARIESPVPITASAGVATYPTHARNAIEMVEAADEALYESKAGGRNRSTVSSRQLLRVVRSEGA